MSVPRIGPEQARSLLEAGYSYLDVRSEPEFALAHPPGAVNVPYQVVEGDRLVPNPDFLRVASASFSPSTRLVVGCHSGSRSRAAARVLSDAGFTELAELRTGFDGCRDAFGRLELGWARSGLPVEHDAAPEQTYAWRFEQAKGRGHAEL